MFPYYPENNIGAMVRFQNYLPFFDNEKISYDIHYIGNYQTIFHTLMEGDKRYDQYKLYIKIFWSRLFQTLKTGGYEAVYIQRGMFPFYPDQKEAIFEKLVYKLNKNITVDFYDADYIVNKSIVHSTVQYCHNVTVVNDFLANYFQKIHPNVKLFPIALTPEKYLLKQIYKSSDSVIKIFWTGTAGNIFNLLSIQSVLKKIAIKKQIQILIVCNKTIHIEGLIVENNLYDPSNFYTLMHSADIALYPVKEGNDTHKGAMAAKALEYAASGLPFVASPWGLSPYFTNKEDVLIANNLQEWEDYLLQLIESVELRKTIGSNARKTFMKYHSTEVSYPYLNKLLFHNHNN